MPEQEKMNHGEYFGMTCSILWFYSWLTTLKGKKLYETPAFFLVAHAHRGSLLVLVQ